MKKIKKEEITTTLKNWSGNQAVSFTSSIQVFKIADGLILNLSDKSLIQNMQTDKCAFEAWCLILKHAINDASKIFLKWDRPQRTEKSKEERHYNRFLYRVNKFNELFEWFEIHKDSIDVYYEDYKKIDFSSGCHVCNVAKKSRNNDITGLKQAEKKLERIFVDDENVRKCLIELVGVKKIDRQLPVGIFKNKVKTEMGIFPRGASQIDIWGIGNNNSTINIFELKAKIPPKVGIISELFFYAMIMNDLINEKVKFESKSNAELKPEELIKRGQNIKAFFLTPGLHPLITKDLVDYLNESLKNKEIKCSFHNIKYDYNDDFKISNLCNPW